MNDFQQNLYKNQCVLFGYSASNKPGFLTWYYTENAELTNRKPIDAVNDGDLPLVWELWNEHHYKGKEETKN